MKKFPVKIDLSTFFEDERKFVIILVDPTWKSVEYLQHRVEEIFDVRPVHFLTSDNLFIPPQESIEVMEFTESLKAFIPKHALEESRRRSKKFLQSEPNRQSLPTEKESVKKRKYHTLETEFIGSSTPNQSKKTKCAPLEVSNLVVPVCNESQEITSTNEQAGTFRKSTKIHPNSSPDKLRISNRKTSDLVTLKNQILADMDEEGLVSISKRKRKRSQKRKVETEKAKGNENSETMQTEIPSSTFLSNSKSVGKNSHVYFDDSTVIESATQKQTTPVNTTCVRDKNNSSKVIFKCFLNNDASKPLVIPLQVINKTRRAVKPLIDIQENILLPPANIDILTKRESTKAMNNDVEKSVLSNTFLNTFDNSTKKNEDRLQSTKDDTRDCFEPNADKSNLNTEKIVNGASITNGLKKIIDSQSSTKHIELEVTEEGANADSENQEKADENEISIEVGKKENEISSVNHSMTEHVGDENKSEKELSNNESELFQESLEKTTANSTDASNNSLAAEESCVIDLDDDEEDVIDLSDADDQLQSFPTRLSTSKLSETLNKSINAMSITEMIPFCTPLTSIPALGDVVIFKFNRKNTAEKKDISEFIACKCEHVNRRTKVLKLTILDASLEKDIIPEHYIYNLDESTDSRFINIKFTEMIEAKVLET